MTDTSASKILLASLVFLSTLALIRASHLTFSPAIGWRGRVPTAYTQDLARFNARKPSPRVWIPRIWASLGKRSSPDQEPLTEVKEDALKLIRETWSHDVEKQPLEEGKTDLCNVLALVMSSSTVHTESHDITKICPDHKILF